MADNSKSSSIPDGKPATARSPGPSRTLRFLRRVPFTCGFLIVFFGLGAATGTFATPLTDLPWSKFVTTGYPALQDGRWWTVLTSAFFIGPPIGALTVLPLLAGGLAWAEYRFGTWRTIVLFWAGHIIGMLGAIGFVATVLPTGWHWAENLATTLDAGPSCGAILALAFATATLPSPWRLRARIALGTWAGVSVLYLGHVYDLEHAIVMVVGLVGSGFLPKFRHPGGRPTEREWRVIALWWMIAFGAIQLIDLAIPYDGPFGRHNSVSSALEIVIESVIIAVLATGIWRGIRLVWIVTLVVGALSIASSVLVISSIPALIAADVITSPTQVLGPELFETLSWIALVSVLIVGRGAFRVRVRWSRRHLGLEALDADRFREILRTHGGGTLAWMSTWAANERVTVGDGALAYQAHSGVAIALGGPITSPERRQEALGTFAAAAQRAGLIPCVFSADTVTAEAAPAGWRSMVVATDTIVDLPGLQFTGKRWGDVRTAINRAERESVRFRAVRLADEPWGVIAQTRLISEQWTGDKGLPEMRFTLGTVDDALDPEVVVTLAVDDDGSVHGITSWLPVHGGDGHIVGWTLDVMRRRDGGFGPAMEFLIGSSIQHFSEQGYEFVSLSGAPLAGESSTGMIDRIMDQLAALIEPLYGFRSLHRFKQKFNPRSEPLYLLYRDEGDLPRIGAALTRAYLPDASLRDMVAAAGAINQSRTR